MSRISLLDVAAGMRRAFYAKANAPAPKTKTLDPARLKMLPTGCHFDIESPVMSLRMFYCPPITEDDHPIITDDKAPIYLHERSINIYKYNEHVFRAFSERGARKLRVFPEHTIQTELTLTSLVLGVFYFSKKIPQAVAFLARGANISKIFSDLGIFQPSEGISAEQVLYAQTILTIENLLGALPVSESAEEGPEDLGRVHIISFGLDMKLWGSRNREELPI